MGNAVSATPKDSSWERTLEHPGGGSAVPEPTPLRRGFQAPPATQQHQQQSPAQQQHHEVVDPTLSSVHRYFAWHVAAVTAGFAAARLLYIVATKYLGPDSPIARRAERRERRGHARNRNDGRDSRQPQQHQRRGSAAVDDEHRRRRYERAATRDDGETPCPSDATVTTSAEPSGAASPMDFSGGGDRRGPGTASRDCGCPAPAPRARSPIRNRPRRDAVPSSNSRVLSPRRTTAASDPSLDELADAAATQDSTDNNQYNGSSGPIGGEVPSSQRGSGGNGGSRRSHPNEVTTTVSEGRWLPVRALGHGSYGTVTLVRNEDTGVYAAVKEVPVQEAGQVTREFTFLANLPSHPHVVRVLGAAVHGRKARLFLEYCPNGSLADVLKPRQPQPESFVRRSIRQILEGLAYLHANNILHRDIKPANILVDSAGVLKIADFGLSRHLDSLKTHTMQAGSPAYMSPESIRGQLSAGSDLWAVGATMVQMLTGELPWAHLDAFRAGREPLLLYIGTHPNEHPEIPTTASPAAQDLLRILFRPDPRTRGSAAVALLHPFFRDGESGSGSKLSSPQTTLGDGTLPLSARRPTAVKRFSPLHSRSGSSLGEISPGRTRLRTNQRIGPPASSEVIDSAEAAALRSAAAALREKRASEAGGASGGDPPTVEVSVHPPSGAESAGRASGSTAGTSFGALHREGGHLHPHHHGAAVDTLQTDPDVSF